MIEVERMGTRFDGEIKELDQQIVTEYYSSWIYSAIHILLMIPKYQDLAELIKRLNVEEELAVEALNKLSKWGLIQRTPHGFEAHENSLHLKEGAASGVHDHINWRLKAIEDVQRNREESLHYSAIFSLAEEDFKHLKKMMATHLNTQRKLIAESKSEEVFVCNLDFYRL